MGARGWRGFRGDSGGGGGSPGSLLGEPGLPLHNRIVPGTASRPPRTRNRAGLCQRSAPVAQPFADTFPGRTNGNI